MLTCYYWQAVDAHLLYVGAICTGWERQLDALQGKTVSPNLLQRASAPPGGPQDSARNVDRSRVEVHSTASPARVEVEAAIFFVRPSGPVSNSKHCCNETSRRSGNSKAASEADASSALRGRVRCLVPLKSYIPASCRRRSSVQLPFD